MIYEKYIQWNMKFWGEINRQPSPKRMANAIRINFMKRAGMMSALGKSNEELGYLAAVFGQLSEELQHVKSVEVAKKKISDFRMKMTSLVSSGLKYRREPEDQRQIFNGPKWSS